MDAKEYLEIALGGNTNISTLTVLALRDLLESYAQIKIKESGHSEMLEILNDLNEMGYDFCYWSKLEEILEKQKK